jgi:hypothetical protein
VWRYLVPAKCGAVGCASHWGDLGHLPQVVDTSICSIVASAQAALVLSVATSRLRPRSRPTRGFQNIS